jgi:hypothetical protein
MVGETYFRIMSEPIKVWMRRSRCPNTVNFKEENRIKE